MLDKLRTLSLIERIALFNKLKNENSLEYKKIVDLPLNDRIKLFTPPHQSRLTGYMLFLRSKNLNVNDGSRIWASFTNEQRRDFEEEAKSLPFLSSRPVIERDHYPLLRDAVRSLRDEFSELNNNTRNFPSRLALPIIPKSQKHSPSAWQHYLKEFNKQFKSNESNPKLRFSQFLKQAASNWNSMSDDQKSMYHSQSVLLSSKKKFEIQ